MSSTGTHEDEKSGGNHLTVWTLSGMTDLRALRYVANLIRGVGWTASRRAVKTMTIAIGLARD